MFGVGLQLEHDGHFGGSLVDLVEAHDASVAGRQPQNGHLVQDFLALVHGAAPLPNEFGGVLHAGHPVGALAHRRELAPKTHKQYSIH